MGTLVIARHGETYSNVHAGANLDGTGADLAASSFTPPEGRDPFDLNPRGLQQRIYLAERLTKEFSFDAVYCSSLPRAVETLEPLRPSLEALGIPVQITDDLRELVTGDYSGIGDAFKGDWKERFDAVYQHELTEWLAQDPEKRSQAQFKFRGGESDEEFHGRVNRILNEITSQYEGKTVLIMAHGHLNQALLRKLDPTAPQHQGYGQGNTGVSVVDFLAQGQIGKIRFLGNQDHLPRHLLLQYKFWKN